jgi:hypothetical protein
VDFEDLETAVGVGKIDFHFYFKTAGAEEGFVDHIEAVCHADYKDVVQLVYTVHFREELVHNCVAYSSSTARSPTLLGDGIEFVKDNDVQITCISFFFILQRQRSAFVGRFASFSASAKSFRMFSSD